MAANKLHTVEEAAAYFQVSTRTIHSFIKQGILTGLKAGRDWRFTDEDLSTATERLRKQTKSPAEEISSTQDEEKQSSEAPVER